MHDGDTSPSDMLLAATRSLRRRWVHSLSPWQISPHQARALRVIGAADGLRLSELAATLRIAPRSATEVVDALAELGAVERVPDAADRRAVQVRITGEGQHLHTEIEAARSKEAQEFFAALSVSEQAELAHLLGRLVEPAAAPCETPRPH